MYTKSAVLFLMILLGFVGNGPSPTTTYTHSLGSSVQSHVGHSASAQELSLYLSVDLRSAPEGYEVAISGNVTLPNGSGTFAEVSVTVRNPFGTTVCLRATPTDLAGGFRYVCVIPYGSPCGEYPIDATASRGILSVSQHTSINLSCISDYSLIVVPKATSVEQGGTLSFNVTVQPKPGFSSAIDLALQNLPNDTSYSFSENRVLPPSSVELTIVTSPSTPVGTFTVRVVATGGGIERDFPISISITPSSNWTGWLVSALALVLVAAGLMMFLRRRRKEPPIDLSLPDQRDALAVVRALTKLEELKASGKLAPGEYERLRKEYDRRLEKLRSGR